MVLIKSTPVNKKRKLKQLTKTKQVGPDWRDEYYVKTYQLAKSGATLDLLANALGVKNTRLQKWMDDKPALQQAWDAGKSTGSVQADYIYGRLSNDAKKVWKNVCQAETEPNGIRKVEMLFDQAGDGIRKQIFLHVLANTHFNPTKACSKVGIPYKQFKRWVEEDYQFSQLIEQMQEHKGNLYEEELTKLAVEDKDPQALIFVNKTYNRKRGYGEKVEIEHSGSINNNTTIELGENLLSRLSQSARREILEVTEQLQLEDATLQAGDVA